MRDVLIVIVNYKVGELCISALRSISDQVDAALGNQVVVVDNASGDGSADLIEAAIEEGGWQNWASLIRSPVNGGFAAGNNVAILPALQRSDRIRYVQLLNPDTFARAGALEELWSFLEANPRVGIAGSRLEDEDGTQHHSRYRFPSIYSEVEARLGLGIVSRLLQQHVVAPPLQPVTAKVDWLAGASMMIRRQVLDDIGPLDDGYFMYFEEVDFCLRARRRGWTCWYINESRVAHFAGKSSGIDMAGAAYKRLPPYWFRSRRRYWVKNHGFAYALLVDSAAITCEILRKLRNFMQRRPNNQPQKFLTDLMRVGLSRGSPRSVPTQGQ
jgi:N-acetylglucosaminyl-diphospho-decaprenol L-rhamnosyltransferase